MAKKGSITVFLTLILSLVLVLLCTTIQSARMAAARTQILCSADIGLYSLFGQYDKEILDSFDLFVLDGSCGGGELKLSEIYNNMEHYVKPVLKQNSQKLTLEQGGFTGYRLLTDEQGEVFYHQVVEYMKETLGSQGIQLLLNQMQNRQVQTAQAEAAGTDVENGKSLDSYETEMSEAAANSQAAREEAALEQGNAFSDGKNLPADPPAVNVVNPITIIKKIMKMSVLDLVIPAANGISDREINKQSLVSGRSLQKGIQLARTSKTDYSYTSQILFQQYLSDKLGNYQKPASKGLAYQMEYILYGKNNDEANLKQTAKRLLLIREGVNMTALLADAGKRMQIQTLALAIASTFLIPPAAVVIEAAIMLCWSFAESILDVRELFAGGRVPLIKNPGDWQLSLENLPYLLDKLDISRRSVDGGMSYEDYLQILLLTQSRETKVKRGMDMLEQRIRETLGNESFLLDSCIVAMEAQLDVKANREKLFTVTKQYSY